MSEKITIETFRKFPRYQHLLKGALILLLRVLFDRGVKERDIVILKNVIKHWHVMDEIFSGIKSGSITIHFRPDGTMGDYRDITYKKGKDT